VRHGNFELNCIIGTAMKHFQFVDSMLFVECWMSRCYTYGHQSQ